MSWDKIPHELKAIPRWCAANNDKIPVHPETGRYLKHSDSLWTFNDVVKRSKFNHIGLFLDKRYGYSCFDVDDPERLDNPSEDIYVKTNIFVEVCSDTYIEHSISGKGLRIWFKGLLPGNFKKENIEGYVHNQFTIVTGNVHTDKPIKENQALLDQVYKEKKGAHNALSEWEEGVEKYSDEEILQRATNAQNGEKVIQLMAGNWRQYGYRDPGTGSIADYALQEMFAFYTQNSEQIFRLWKPTPLGQRPTAERKGKKHAMRGIQKIITKIRDEKQANGEMVQIEVPDDGFEPIEGPEGAERVTKYIPLPLPNGFLADTVAYLNASNVMPVTDIALLTTLGLMGAVAGRAYIVDRSGLSLYLMLLAKTGTGKEGVSMGAHRIVKQVANGNKAIWQFIGPNNFTSGSSLHKELVKRPSMLCVFSEFALRLRRLNDVNNVNMNSLQELYLDLFSKSGQEGILQPLAYSDSKNTPEIVSSPNFNFIAESTPDRIYELMEIEGVTSGLLPRILIHHYIGPRLPINYDRIDTMPQYLVKRWRELMEKALELNIEKQIINVELTTSVQRALREYDERVTAAINDATMDDVIQFWNRANLYARRLAGIYAVADNLEKPVMQPEHLEWAVTLVDRCVNAIIKRFSGTDATISFWESAKESALHHCKAWVHNDRIWRAGHNCANKTLYATEDRVVPVTYLKRRLARLKAVKDHKLGPKPAINALLQDLAEDGRLSFVSPQVAHQNYRTKTRLVKLL